MLQFSQEKKAHAVTRKKLMSSEKKLKQLNRGNFMWIPYHLYSLNNFVYMTV